MDLRWGVVSISNENMNARDRLLEVMRIMDEYTDDEKMMTIHEIHGSYSENGNPGIGAVRKDVDSLEKSIVFPVTAVQGKEGTVKRYFYDGRLFKIHELRILMDMISAAKFIPKKERNVLLMKIKQLTSRRIAQQLKNELQVADKPNHEEVEIVTFIQQLHEAVQENRVIAFQYGDYNTDIEFTLRDKGKDYFVEPYELVWKKERYYLIGNFVSKGQIRQYRVDRMRNIRLLDEEFVPEPNLNIDKYISGMFHMFGGDTISLEVEFDSSLLNAVVDRFGVDANITVHENDTFILKTRAVESKGLVQWLLRWGSDAKVLHPDKLINDMKEETKKLYNLYH